MEEARDAARRLVVLLPGRARPDGLAQPTVGPTLLGGRPTKLALVGIAFGAAAVFTVLVGLAPRSSSPFSTKPPVAMPAASMGKRSTIDRN